MSDGAEDSAQYVPMARREIVDLVYRCCRVQGVEAGRAHRCAENVAHGEVHRGRSVEAFLVAVGLGAESLRTFVCAADEIELAEATGTERVDFGERVALASLSASLHDAAGRGHVAVDVAVDEQASQRVAWITLRKDQVSDEHEQEAAQRERQAGTHGVPVLAEQLEQLESHAAAYLVPEPDIDAAVAD